MNLLHLKYAVEVEKTKSISKAAENLYMNQPNLSRAIKELEESLSVTLFKRTSKGISVTPQGEEFLSHAKKILSQVDEVEAMYKNGKRDSMRFSISVPRDSYFSEAFYEFAKENANNSQLEYTYRETNAMRAISNILQADYRLGVIRYQSNFESYFNNMLYEKDLYAKLIGEFSYYVTFSKNHPLAKKQKIYLNDLKPFIEIAHADPYVPSLPFADVKKAELFEFVDKRIFVFERASQLELLENVNETFMWGTKLPETILQKFELVQKECEENQKRYRDVLIYKNGYHLTELDHSYIDKLAYYAKELRKET